MSILEKLNSNYLFSEDIILNKNIINKISQVDTLVFDIDGVLIDVCDSYREAICRTVQFYFKEILHFQGSQNLIYPEEIEHFKMAGGFNNDWDLTSAVIPFYLMKARKDNLNNLNEIISIKPDIKTFTTKMLPPGGGLSEIVNLIEKDKEMEEKILPLWHKDLITKIFQEIYAGEEYCFNIYGFQPSLIKAEGLIKRERVIIDKKRKILCKIFLSVS